MLKARPVGRTAELAVVDGLLGGLRAGRGGVLLVLGEPGIGKTTLVDYAVAQAADVQVLRFNGSDAERDLPFAGLAQLVRLSADELERLPGPQADALGVALALRHGPRVDRLAVATATLSWLTAQSETRPLLVVIDDGHLLDQPTQEVLSFVARRLLADAVVMIAAARSGEPCLLVAGDVPRLELDGFGDAETAALLGGDGRRPEPDLVARVRRITGGNPLAIAELAADPDRLRALPGVVPGPIPDTLSRWYAARPDGWASTWPS